MRILIVDDEEPNRYQLEAMLGGCGHEVVTANHGAEALLKARQQPPDLVISDILMPVMDGFALCRAWKQDPRLADIPFIFYTATYTDPKDEELALSLGADQFVVKPVEPEAFLTLIHKSVRTVGRRPPEAQTPPQTEPRRVVVEAPEETEAAYLQQYNQALIHKLEHKVEELEQARRQLEREAAERDRLEAERLELLARVQQQQRLEAVGTLAAGVAHEINNPINAVMNYAELLREELRPEQGRLREQATQIIREAERVAGIVRDLLQFARQERVPRSVVEVGELVEGTLSLIRTIIKRDQIRLEVDLPRGLPRVRCRSQQIQQVLMNLLINGRDALNAKYAGWHEDKVLRVSGGVVEEGGVRWVRVSVEDHGTGIEPEVRRRMFDPFFTTKDRALGSGLGLSVSLGIVREHGGRLEVETEPGRYTRMHLDLPVESEAEQAPAPPASAAT